MKLFFCLMLLTWSSASGAADEELTKAFQREFSALIAQKEAFTRALEKSETEFERKKSEAEKELHHLERKLVRETSANDEVFEGLQILEKERREQGNRESSLAAVLKKSLKSLDEHERAFRFEETRKSEPDLPEPLTLASFESVHRRSLRLLQDSSSVTESTIAYLNAQGELVETPVRRFGRVAAWGLTSERQSVLGPDGSGRLRELERVEASRRPFWSLYLFESLQDKAVVKKPATVLDRFADAAPLAFLAALFLMVGALFLALARE